MVGSVTNFSGVYKWPFSLISDTTVLILLVDLKINNFTLDSFKESLLALIQSVKHLSSLFMI